MDVDVVQTNQSEVDMPPEQPIRALERCSSTVVHPFNFGSTSINITLHCPLNVN